MVTQRTLLRVWIGLTLVGGILIALPDDDRRLFSLSGLHGPAALDAVGALLALVAMAAFLGLAARAWPHVRAWRFLPASALVWLAGSGLCGWSVATDAGRWWMLGVVLMLGAQVAVAWRATDQR